MKDYYKILGVSKTATDEEIRKAYKKLSMKYHPDRPDGDEEKFKLINEAYNILNDPVKRVQYNQGNNPSGNNNSQPSGRRFNFSTGGMPQGFNFQRFTTTNSPFSGTFFGSENFEHMFDNEDDFNPFKRQKIPEQELILKLSLEDMYKGCETTVSYPKTFKVENETYSMPETMTLTIPPKSYIGKKLKVTIPDDVQAQSIIIVIQPKKHTHYKVKHNDYIDSADLELNMSISLKESLVGFRMRIPGIDGNEIVVEEDTIIDPKKPYMISGKGFVNREGKRGNLYINFDIKYPKKLTQKQRTEIKKILA